jgi:glycosyltransferase involved in cell wall biosynthesis
MKKSILFSIDSLHCAGAEKSLTTLLSLIDYSKYEVDLMMFGHGGALEELVPKEVNILKPLKYTQFTEKSLKESIIYTLKKGTYKMLKSRIGFSLAIRNKQYSNAQKARILWQKTSSVIEDNPKKYDIAISYAQGLPTFYVADKINADKKFAWVNVSYRLKDEDKEFQCKYYDKYEKIIAVSHSAKDVFLETFPKYKDKVEIIYDINDFNLISKMADMENGYDDKFDGIRLLTIGRLANQKGYDIALEACKILKDKGIKFKWYALGKGPLKSEIEKYIKENDLQDYFKLLGVKSNPYPYIKDADIYVQTSKFEGFGLAIAEARMLNIPVVTTEFDAVYNQMIQGKNGLVVKQDPFAVADAIELLLNDKDLYQEIQEFQKNEKKGNLEEIEKFYRIIEDNNI